MNGPIKISLIIILLISLQANAFEKINGAFGITLEGDINKFDITQKGKTLKKGYSEIEIIPRKTNKLFSSYSVSTYGKKARYVFEVSAEGSIRGQSSCYKQLDDLLSVLSLKYGKNIQKDEGVNKQDVPYKVFAILQTENDRYIGAGCYEWDIFGDKHWYTSNDNIGYHIEIHYRIMGLYNYLSKLSASEVSPDNL